MKKYISALIILSSCSHFGPKYSAEGDTAEAMNQKQAFAPYDQYMANENETPVSDQLSKPEFKKEFVKEICSGKNDKDCNSKWWQMVEAKFNVTYKQANPNWIGTQCQAEILKCKKDLKYIEALYIKSNNSRVIDAYNKDQEVERKIAKEKRKNAWAGFFQGMAQYNQQQEKLKTEEKDKQPPRMIIQPGGKQTNCYDMGNGHTQCNSNK